jgi:hypothetical protein
LLHNVVYREIRINHSLWKETEAKEKMKKEKELMKGRKRNVGAGLVSAR